MPPVELESDAPLRREDVHALLFRLDDFAYSEALRSLFAIDPSFEDRPCYIAPSKDVVPLDLFERLPEVDLPPHVHGPAWRALEGILRSLMSDKTLLSFVRGESQHGTVSFGYHASAPYAAVERVLSERVSVLSLRALRDAAQSGRRALSVEERASSLANDAAVDEAQREAIRRWARGERPWDEAWSESALRPAVLALNIARTFDANSEADRRIADRLLGEIGGVEAWIYAVPPDPLNDHFAPVRAYVLDAESMSDDALLAHCLLARGGQPESGAWWWTLAQLADKERVAGVLRAMDRPEHGVERLVELARSARPSMPVVLDYARAIGAADSTWDGIVSSGLR